MRRLWIGVIIGCMTVVIHAASIETAQPQGKHLAYIVSDIRIPFWEIMSRGILSKANELGYEVTVYSADNMKKSELQNLISALQKRPEGIILSPISSSTAVTLLKLSERVGVPVVISDIGTDEGSYVSYISSDNMEGAYKIGKVLAEKMRALHWEDGTVGIVSIPQKRSNGKARTAGFMRAMEEAGIKAAGLRQQVDFSYQETYAHATALIGANPKLRALWLQGSDRYQGALDAISDSGREGEILLLCFDAEPEFLEMIPKGILVGAAMQQPFLMGEEAVITMDKHLRDIPVPQEIKMPILAISTENIDEHLYTFMRNVLGVERKNPTR